MNELYSMEMGLAQSSAETVVRVKYKKEYPRPWKARRILSEERLDEAKSQAVRDFPRPTPAIDIRLDSLAANIRAFGEKLKEAISEAARASRPEVSPQEFLRSLHLPEQ